MAPLLAALPYKTVASGPFKTVTDSISFGLISDILLVKSLEVLFCPAAAGTELTASMEELSLITPSMTNKGWLLRDSELYPLNTIVDEDPGTPDVEVMVAPAIRPCNPLTKLSRCVSFNSAPFTSCVEYPKSLFLRLISMATTTSSNSTTVLFNAISILPPVTLIRCDSKPI